MRFSAPVKKHWLGSFSIVLPPSGLRGLVPVVRDCWDRDAGAGREGAGGYHEGGWRRVRGGGLACAERGGGCWSCSWRNGQASQTIYICMYTCVYIYIEREREKHTHLPVPTYLRTYIHTYI